MFILFNKLSTTKLIFFLTGNLTAALTVFLACGDVLKLSIIY